MRVLCVIPSRYGSTRLPGKPLADIHGKPMVQHVYENVSQASLIDDIVVATDDKRIVEAVESFGGKSIMTSQEHASGTERIVEVASKIKADFYVNVQGDEPLIRSDDVDALVKMLSGRPHREVGSLCHPMFSKDLNNPNVVKVVLNHNNDAMYFSRLGIPFLRKPGASHLAHMGLYAYRHSVIERFSSLPPSPLADSEQLEQLRFLQADIAIAMGFTTPGRGPAVDTPQDLARVRAIVAGQSDPPLSSFHERLIDVQLVITDVDGVLTNGTLWYSEAGESLKSFHVRDGLGVRYLQAAGVQVAILSGRDSPSLRRRVADLAISHAVYGSKNKDADSKSLMNLAGVSPWQTLFIGDDLIDLPGFAVCGLSCAVEDAHPKVKENASKVLSSGGGAGAFREVSEMILTAKGIDINSLR